MSTTNAPFDGSDSTATVAEQTSAPFDITTAPPNWLEQDDKLRAFWGENKTPDEIAALLGRSVAAVMTRAARLGLPRRTAPGRKRGYKRTDLKARSLSANTKVRVRAPRSVGEADADPYPARATIARVCLMCLNKFQSDGPHNRICSSCKGSAEYATGSSTPDFTFRVST